jgi:hypothetical protein
MSISSIILVVLMRFLASGYPLSRVVFEQASATETARVQLKRIALALREARESDAGSYPLVAVEPQRLIFYADVDADDATERIRYELSGTQLLRGVIQPSGTPVTYNPASEVVTVAAANIRNGADPVFVYYSGDYPADDEELTSADLVEVKYLEFRLLVDTNTAIDPPPLELTSHVALRNLKTNLAQEVEE